MKLKLSSKGKMLKVAEGKLKYHMSQNAMVTAYSASYAGFSKGTVNSLCQIIDENKLTAEAIISMSDEECDSLLRPKQSKQHNKKKLPDFYKVHEKLKSDTRMTLFFLWRMYCKETEDPYSYSRYCELYDQWCHKNKKAPVLVMNEVPGQNMYVDWIGDTLDFSFDGQNIETIHFFCTSLGMSQYPYCEGFRDEKLPSYIKGHIHAFEYYGGLPKYVVPDNTKCATVKNHQTEVILNKVYEDMQEHYGYVVLPARPKAPTDKNDVELTCGWFERQLLMEIKDKEYCSLEDLNGDILRICEELSDMPYQVKSGSRTDWFNEYDKPELKPLPPSRFEVYDYCFAKVPDNYHINIKGDKDHYYSVPHEYCDQDVLVKYSFDKVIIYDMNNVLIAQHNRSYTRYTYYSTKDEHMPANHQIAKDIKTKDSNWYIRMASFIGHNTEKVIRSILASKKHPEQGYRSCMGIIAMHMNHKYTDREIEMVCKEAVEMNTMTYSFVIRRIKELKKEADEMHENVRGPQEYE